MADIAELGVKITTEGAREAAQQLEEVARSAERAAGATESLSGKSREGSQSASSLADALSEAASATGILKVGAIGAAGGIGFVLGSAIGELLSQLPRLISDIVTAGDKLKDLAAKTSMSTDQLQRWAYVGRQVGIDSGTMTMAVQMLQQRLGDVADGSGRAAQALRQLGLTQSDLDAVSNDTNATLMLLHQRMQGIQDPTERANLLYQLFGRSARELTPIFRASAEELGKLTREFDALGMAMSERLIDASDRFSDSMLALGQAIRGSIYPAVEALMVPIADLVQGLKDSAIESGAFRDAAALLAQVAHLLSVPLRAAGIAAVGLANGLQIVVIAARQSAIALLALAQGELQVAKQAMADMVDQIGRTSTVAGETIRKLSGLMEETAVASQSLAQSFSRDLARAIELTSRYTAVASGVTGTYQSELAALKLRLDAGNLSQAEYVRAVEELIKKQPSASRAMDEYRERLRSVEKAARSAAEEQRNLVRWIMHQHDLAVKFAKDEIKLEEERRKEVEKLEDAMQRAELSRVRAVLASEREEEAVRKRIEAEQFRIDKARGLISAYDMLETRQLRHEAAMLREMAATMALAGESEELIASYRRRADALEELAGKIVEAAQAEQVRDEWVRISQDIERALTDALVRAWDTGKSFLKSVGDYIANYFKTFVARSIAGALMGAIGLGLSGVANAAGLGGALGGVGGGLGMLGSLGSLAGIGTLGSFALTGLMSSLTGTGLGTTLGASWSLLTGGNIAGGIGMGLGAIAPYALAAYGIYSLLTGAGTGRSRHPAIQNVGISNLAGQDLGLGWWAPHTPNGGVNQDYVRAAAGIAQQVEAYARLFGGASNPALTYGLYTSHSPDGRGALVSARVQYGTSGSAPALFARNSQGANEDMMQRLMSFVPNMILAGLQQSTLPQRIKEYFSSVSVDAITQEQLNSMLQVASAAHQMAEAFKDLGGPFLQLTDLTVDMRQSIAELTGGMDAFMQKVAGYYQEFYSPEEQQALALLQAQRILESAGINTAGITGRESFRAAVEGLDLSTEEGRRQFAAFMNAAGAFAGGADLLAASGMSLAEFTAGAPAYAALEAVASQGVQTNDLLASINSTLVEGFGMLADVIRRSLSIVVNVGSGGEVGLAQNEGA